MKLLLASLGSDSVGWKAEVRLLGGKDEVDWYLGVAMAPSLFGTTILFGE